MPSPSPDVITRARQMYADNVPVARIRTELRISQDTLYRCIDGALPGPDADGAPLARRRGGRARVGSRRRLRGQRDSVIARLWRTAEAQVRDIEERLMRERQEPAERERDARVMAVLAKTLRDLSALDEQCAAPPAPIAPEDRVDDEGPKDLDEFRAELARRIDAFVASRTGADLPRAGEDGADDPSAP
ncbi:MAG: hypothetical protein HY056_08010 [Proteobacteria bacterium]|nr:hypothetical protein [Pseudomonadota bacterium]